MKKIWATLLLLLGLGLVIQSTSCEVQASRDYQIQKYDIVANVKKNGDIEMTQRLNYQFDGDFHGVYYNQSLKRIKGISQPKVFIQENGQKFAIKDSNSGQNNTVKVTKTKNNLGMKVYHEISSSEATFIYQYTLKGLVTNYNDTAVLNWRVINPWEVTVKHIKVTINLPQKSIPQLQVWSHGTLQGYNHVDRQNGRVIITVPRLLDDNFVETRMLFPTSVTSTNQNIVAKNMKSKVRAKEKQLAQETNQKRQNQEIIYRSLMVLGFLVILIIYGYKFIMLKKEPANKHNIPTPLYHSFDAPAFLPSFSKVILERSDEADAQGLTADLMNEVGRRRMKIEKVGKTYEITAVVPPTEDFFKYLINDIGDGTKVTLKQIKKEGRDYDGESRFKDHYSAWAKEAAKDRQQYLDVHNIDIAKGFQLAALTTTVLVFIMFVISMLFNKPVLMPALIALIVAAIAWGINWWMHKKITPYTDEGEVAVNQIRAFKRMLEDIDDIKMAEVGDIILWEQFIPFAVAFGISDKVIKALKLNFSPEQIDQSVALVNYIGLSHAFGSNSSPFQSAFMGAIGSTGAANVSGGSGGFSGGSSGGFGGGSGGAF